MLTQTGAVRAWWSLFMVLVAALLVAGASVMYTQHAQREADRRWCELLTTLDAPSPSPPPATERGQEIQRQLRQLQYDLGCEREEPW
ncbi:hypothetical protein GCM10010182_67750 [Actinomadura cremea]|nr:hypothetical protein GCM10010182_67750 [Actinomadura cremea]